MQCTKKYTITGNFKCARRAATVFLKTCPYYQKCQKKKLSETLLISGCAFLERTNWMCLRESVAAASKYVMWCLSFIWWISLKRMPVTSKLESFYAFRYPYKLSMCLFLYSHLNCRTEIDIHCPIKPDTSLVIYVPMHIDFVQLP